MTRQTQRSLSFNSPINVSRRSKQQPIIAVKRNVIPIKLPTIVNRTQSTTVKPSSSFHLRNLSQSIVPSSIPIDQFSPQDDLQPILLSSHFTLIKDHTIKQNLSQKAILKCKSPRAGSAISRSTIFGGTDIYEQTKSRRPLQGMDVGALLTEAVRNRLTLLFNKIDTDKDGHLSYSQVQICLPPNFPHAQMTFFRVLYDVISGTTFFGLQEFYAIAIIVELVAQQNTVLWKTFLDDVDFNYYHEDILELVDEFNDQCPIDRHIISYEIFLELVMKRIKNGKIERITNELQCIVPNIKTMKINRIDFISFLPLIIYIESCFNHEQSLFRFRENSLLDKHMQRALLS
ncbi:unnamed protein product [Adineta steineri]|uniref:EF-hand domain-containing protein n=1 Tax=Adineta steineri TaxID=433720 RepID=A0A815M2Y1_9BILA|nr:unnamed protein product [Adineta steineri]